jgi:glycosyltransferase involved in cell wall biosynthesis
MPIRVVHIAKIIQIAGAERHLLTLLPALRAAGVDARMIAFEKGESAAQFIQQLRDDGVPFETLLTPTGERLINRDLPAFLHRLRALLREHQPDIVHTHLIHGDIYGTVAARAAGVRHIVSSRHNLDPFRRQRKWQAVTSVLWRANSGGIAMSDAVRDFMVQVEHAPLHKISTIKHGIIPPEPLNGDKRAAVRRAWGIDADAPVVGSVSRLIKQKGLTHAVEAFAQVRHPNAHYVIAGDGELRASLQQQAVDRGLGDSIHFLGWQDDVHRVLGALDVLLAPSLWEGFGVVFLEAMGHALPILTTHVPPIPEVVLDGVTGCTVEPASSAALVEPLRRLLLDSDLRQTMGTAGRLRLENVFSVNKMVEQTVAFYERLLA